MRRLFPVTHASITDASTRGMEKERERDLCLHQTDVIEHVIYLNGIVCRNRNSVTCGSSGIMVMSGDDSNGIPILYIYVRHNGNRRGVRDRSILWVMRHPSRIMRTPLEIIIEMGLSLPPRARGLATFLSLPCKGTLHFFFVASAYPLIMSRPLLSLIILYSRRIIIDRRTCEESCKVKNYIYI